MKKTNTLFIAFGLAWVAIIFWGYSGGVADTNNLDASGSPFSTLTCGSCHSGSVYGTTFSIEIKEPGTGMAVTEYMPDSIYNVEFTVNTSMGSPQRYGFQSIALIDADSTNAGSIFNPASNTDIITLSGRLYAEHTNASLTANFAVDWQAPPSGSGSVTFYGAGNAVNNTGSTAGDDGTGPVSVTLNEFIPANMDATLSDLQVDGMTVPGFTPLTTSYNIELAFGTTTVPTVTAVANDTGATVMVNPTFTLPGTTMVVVTAQDGITTGTYNVNFSVAPNNNANLADLLVDGVTVTGFSASDTAYLIELPTGTTTPPAVTAIPEDTNASVSVFPPTSVPGTTIVEVTAEDGSTMKSYTVDFTVISGTADPEAVIGAVKVYSLHETRQIGVHLQGDVSQPLNLKVFNASGKLLITEAYVLNSTRFLSTGSWRAGIYVLWLGNHEQAYTRTILVN